MIRFVLGAIMVIGALVFLGAWLRMVLRMAAGDLNAYVALVDLQAVLQTGRSFLEKDFRWAERMRRRNQADMCFRCSFWRFYH